jgi:hypothetical protein
MKKAPVKRGAKEPKEQLQAGSNKVNNTFAGVKKLEEEFQKVMLENKGIDMGRVPDRAHQLIEQAIGLLTDALAGM